MGNMTIHNRPLDNRLRHARTSGAACSREFRKKPLVSRVKKSKRVKGAGAEMFSQAKYARQPDSLKNAAWRLLPRCTVKGAAPFLR